MLSIPLVNTLKATLKLKGISYNDIAKMLKLSEVTIKRSFSRKAFSLERFLQILDCCKIQLSDLNNLAKERSKSPHQYTEAQETYFTKNLDCLFYFDLLIRYGSPTKANKAARISKNQAQKFLLDLDKIDLIQLGLNLKVKFHRGRDVIWRKNGPLRKTLLQKAKNEFLKSNFEGSDQLFNFSLLDLSEESAKRVSLIVNESLKQINLEAELNQYLDIHKKRFGLLIAKREWNFSVLSNLSEKLKEFNPDQL